jgi:hypothetical protein
MKMDIGIQKLCFIDVNAQCTAGSIPCRSALDINTPIPIGRNTEETVKIAGHPVHPMLIVFPLGLLGTAVIFDIIRLTHRTENGPPWPVRDRCRNHRRPAGSRIRAN